MQRFMVFVVGALGLAHAGIADEIVKDGPSLSIQNYVGCKARLVSSNSINIQYAGANLSEREQQCDIEIGLVGGSKIRQLQIMNSIAMQFAVMAHPRIDCTGNSCKTIYELGRRGTLGGYDIIHQGCGINNTIGPFTSTILGAALVRASSKDFSKTYDAKCDAEATLRISIKTWLDERQENPNDGKEYDYIYPSFVSPTRIVVNVITNSPANALQPGFSLWSVSLLAAIASAVVLP